MKETEIEQFKREIKNLKLRDQNDKLWQKLYKKQQELENAQNQNADLEDLCIEILLYGSDFAYKELRKKLLD